MHKFIFTSLAIFFLNLLNLKSDAQVTINQSNYNRPTALSDLSRLDLNGSLSNIPSTGAAQTWDYAHIIGNVYSPQTFSDATSNPIFSNAFTTSTSEIRIAGCSTNNRQVYWGLDNNGGLYPVGSSITNQNSHSLNSLTGGANDSILFPIYNDTVIGRVDDLIFPTTYQTQWSQVQTETLPYELTIASLGLNQAAGFRKSIISVEKEVVGYGTLRIPSGVLGIASPPFDALLVQTNQTQVDSFFLNGAPASTSTLSMLGLTQNSIQQDTFYTFYAPYSGGYILNVTHQGYVSYRPNTLSAVLAIKDIQVNTSNCFPNPIQARQTLTIQTNKNIYRANLIILDINGRIVFESKISDINNNEYQCTLPQNITSGLYFYQLTDEKTQQQAQGKFQVE